MNDGFWRIFKNHYICTNQPKETVYKQGLHLISDFSVENPEVLKDSSLAKSFFENVIHEYGLTSVGDVYHQFPESGYTAVICLTESHISVHTWPEFNRVTFDVFLSNYQKFNNQTVEDIHMGFLKLLNARDINTTRLIR